MSKKTFSDFYSGPLKEYEFFIDRGGSRHFRQKYKGSDFKHAFLKCLAKQFPNFKYVESPVAQPRGIADHSGRYECTIIFDCGNFQFCFEVIVNNRLKILFYHLSTENVYSYDEGTMYLDIAELKTLDALNRLSPYLSILETPLFDKTFAREFETVVASNCTVQLNEIIKIAKRLQTLKSHNINDSDIDTIDNI